MAALGTADSEEALDIVQETMMVFAQRYASKSPAEWPPLFYRILQNKLRDWHRRRAVRGRWMVGWRFGGRGEARDYVENAVDKGPGPERSAVAGDAAEALEMALQGLPPRQRQAFLLRAWEGLDLSDTARAMGCTVGSVKTHYFRALRSLRQQLEEHWS